MDRTVFKPTNAEQVLATVQWAAAEDATLEIRGSGSKRAWGRPVRAEYALDLRGLTGIGLYEPQELVMTTAAGTPMAEVTAALAAENQQLAFEPPDLGPLLGAPAGGGTIGGVIAANLAGPRRLQVGAARDHLLGFEGVSGRGEIFKSGGRVVKNVTGFDLSKLMAGSFGTLAVLTSLSVKVLPRPEKARTVLVLGVEAADVARALSDALRSPHEVSGAAHLPAGVAARSGVSYVAGAGAAVTAIRVEGPGPSVEVRARALRDLLGGYGATEELHTANTEALWREIRDVAYFAQKGDGRQVWRLSVPPTDGPRVAADILGQVDGEAFYDWGGGLVWLALAPAADAHHETVRGAIGADGGHATLIRAADEVRAIVPVFPPQPEPLAALSARVKAQFDPRGILNPGRMTGEA